jgi:cysteine-rich repeat protein
MLLPIDMAMGQECDDGNLANGDGCSSTCKRELGFECTDLEGPIDLSRLPTIFRDFKPYKTTDADSHPDFERFGTMLTQKIVADTLAADGQPTHRRDAANAWINYAVTTNGDGAPFDPPSTTSAAGTTRPACARTT